MKTSKVYWSFINQGGGRAELRIYERIGPGGFFSDDGVTAKKFAQDLKDLGDDITQLDIRINSPGGAVFEGLAIHNILDNYKANKDVFIDGIAASIASVIAMAGDKIHMPKNTLMMIHDPSGVVQGTAKDMQGMAEALQKVKEAIAATYVSRTGLGSQEISDMMESETWMTAEEAVAKGFADTVSDAVSAENLLKHDLDCFVNVPEILQEREEEVEVDEGFWKKHLLPIFNKLSKDERGNETMDLATLKSKHPDVADALLEEGRQSVNVKDAAKEAAEKERKRIQEVMALGDGLEDTAFLRKLAIEDGLTKEEAAVALVEHQRLKRKGALEDLEDDSVDPVKPSSGKGEDIQLSDDLPAEEYAEKAWKANAIFAETGRRVKDEFLDKEGLQAYIEACRNGQVKMLTGKESK